MKTALITGASQGIGAAIADKLNDKKIKVILVSRSKSKLKSFQKNLKFTKNSLIISKDLRSLSACNSIAKKIKKLDYLINVAGATKGGKFLNLSDNIWEDGFNLKFKAAVRLSRAFWPALKKSKGKFIISRVFRIHFTIWSYWTSSYFRNRARAKASFRYKYTITIYPSFSSYG